MHLWQSDAYGTAYKKAACIYIYMYICISRPFSALLFARNGAVLPDVPQAYFSLRVPSDEPFPDRIRILYTVVWRSKRGIWIAPSLFRSFHLQSRAQKNKFIYFWYFIDLHSTMYLFTHAHALNFVNIQWHNVWELNRRDGIGTYNFVSFKLRTLPKLSRKFFWAWSVSLTDKDLQSRYSVTYSNFFDYGTSYIFHFTD